MIPKELIERALSLTDTDMEMMECSGCHDEGYANFHIEKFFCYLLSEEFISKYPDEYNLNPEVDFLYAIREYQKGNEKPLIYLLSKI